MLLFLIKHHKTLASQWIFLSEVKFCGESWSSYQCTIPRIATPPDPNQFVANLLLAIADAI